MSMDTHDRRDRFFKFSPTRLLKQKNQQIKNKQNLQKKIQNCYNIFSKMCSLKIVIKCTVNLEGILHSSHGTVRAGEQEFLEGVRSRRKWGCLNYAYKFKM